MGGENDDKGAPAQVVNKQAAQNDQAPPAVTAGLGGAGANDGKDDEGAGDASDEGTTLKR